MPGRATIHQVAKELGISASTVSRAFNSPNMLRPATVARVTETAERLGYVPNRYAQVLATGKTGLIALIVPDITNPFFPPIVRAAQREAEKHGSNVLLVETNSQPDRERRQIASLSPHCQGMIIASSRLTAEELRGVAATTRLVLINNDSAGVARILTSAAAALNQGVNALIDAGARSVLYLGGPHRSWSESERHSTVERICRVRATATSVIRVESGTYDEARQLMRGIGKPADAVIAFDDVIACGVLDGLHDQGIDIPADVRILGCDDALPVRTRPRLSTIRLSPTRAAQEAVSLVVETSETMVSERRILLEGELHLRETTGDLAAGSGTLA